jgi:hypothetical protein
MAFVRRFFNFIGTRFAAARVGRPDRSAALRAEGMERLEGRCLLSAVPAAQLLDTPVKLPANITAGADTNVSYLGRIPTAVVGDKAIFGDAVGPNGVNATFNVYDAATGGFLPPPAIQAAFEQVSAVSGGKAYFAGGLTDLKHSGISGAVEIYDSATNQWSTSTLPDPGIVGAAVAVGGKVLFSGGHIAPLPEDGDADNFVDIYDTGTSQWSTARLSGSIGAIVAATIDNTVIFAGADGQNESVVDMYDAGTGKWSTAPLSVARSPEAVVSVGKYVLLAGASSGLGLPAPDTRAVDIYNSETGKWSKARLTQKRQGFKAVVVGDLAIFAGGDYYDKKGNHLQSDVVDIFNARTGRWTTSKIPNPLGSHVRTAKITAATVLGEEAIFMGYRGAYVFDTRTRSWFTGAASSVNDNAQAAVTVGGKVVIIADGFPNGIYLTDADILTPTGLSPPSPTSPVNATKMKAVPVRFAWTPVQGATTYDNFVNGAFVARVASAGYSTTTSFYSGVLYWQIFAHVGDALLAGPIWSFTVA